MRQKGFELRLGSEKRPLFHATAEGISLFSKRSCSEWDEENERWLVTHSPFQPLGVPWHAVVAVEAGSERRRVPGGDKWDERAAAKLNALVIRAEVEPTVDFGNYHFAFQGYTKGDLVGLSREEWNEDDLFSRIAIPRRNLPVDLEEAVSRVTTLWEKYREDSARENRPYVIPEPKVKEAGFLTKFALRNLRRLIRD